MKGRLQRRVRGGGGVGGVEPSDSSAARVDKGLARGETPPKDTMSKERNDL